MKYLLDTDISSYYLRGKNNLLYIFEEKGFQNIRISRVTIAELEALANRDPSSKINFVSIKKLAELFGIIEVDINTWKIYSKLKADMLNRGIPKGDMDTLIASIANQYEMILITNNISHFQDLTQVENWVST